MRNGAQPLVEESPLLNAASTVISLDYVRKIVKSQREKILL